MTIEISQVVNDPDVAQAFTILRSVGAWNLGTWVPVTANVQSYGVITEPTVNELEMVPEGDKVKGVMVFWSSQPIFVTSAAQGVGNSSDIIVWRGQNFRVLSVKQYLDWGYYRAIATRMKAD